MFKSKRIKNLLTCFISCFLLLSSTVVSVAAKENGNDPYSKLNAMLVRLFSGNTINITVQKNELDITEQFINRGYDVRVTNVSFILQAYGSENEWEYGTPMNALHGWII